MSLTCVCLNKRYVQILYLQREIDQTLITYIWVYLVSLLLDISQVYMVFTVLLTFELFVSIICFSSSLPISLPVSLSFCTPQCRSGAMSTLNGNQMNFVELNI